MRTTVFVTLGLCLAAGFGESCTPKTSQATTASAEVPTTGVETSSNEQALPFDADVLRGKLANGLEYYILPNQRPAERAELRLVVKAGSILEDDDQQGLAHFVEHMAFNGTTNYTDSELIDYLQSTGAKFGPDLNAYTSFDETVYMLQVRTDSAEVLDKGLGILRDWAGGITFDDAEIDKERGVVLSEYRSGLGADERMRNKTLPVVLANSRYAERLPIGDTAVLKRAPYDALKRYYRNWYRPNLMAVVVVGDVDATAMEAKVKSLFGSLRNPEGELERTEYGGPRYDGTQVVVATDAEATYALAQVYYLLPESNTRTRRDYRESLAASLYNQMLGARFREKTEDPTTPYSFAGAGRGGFIGNVDAYSSFALAKPGLMRETVAAVAEENRRVIEYGFLSPELERAKANVLDAARNAEVQAATTPSNQLVSGLVSSFLEAEPFTDAETDLELTEALLSGITLEEVNALAETFTKNRPRAVVVTGPESQPLPTEEQLLATLDEVATIQVTAYEEAAAATATIPELQSVDVVSTKEYAANDITVLTLDNGVRVAYKQTAFANDEIAFAGVSKGGSNQYDDSAYPSAELAGGIGSAMGLGPYTPSQLQKALAGKRVGVSAFVGEDTEGLRGQATPETLEELMRLTYLHFAGGAYDAALAEAFVGQQMSFMENMAASPNYQFQEKVNTLLYGTDNPRHQMPSVERMQASDTEQAYELYRQRFADAKDWQFSFVGDFDVDTLTALAQRYLGNLPSSATGDAMSLRPDPIATGNLSERFEAGQAEKAQVLLGFGGDFVDSERERIRFSSMTDLLGEELREKLREDMGGVYGVGVRGNTDLPLASAPAGSDATYFVTISFNAEPDRVDELLAAVTEVVERVDRDGPQAKFVASNRETSVQAMKQAMTSSNNFWVEVLQSAYTFERDLDQTSAERQDELLGEFTAQDFAAATKQYLGDAATTTLEVVMLPKS